MILIPQMTRLMNDNEMLIQVIGACMENDELLLLIKWKNVEETDLVKAKEANVKIPQVIIIARLIVMMMMSYRSN